jgi:hypothetical protein
MQAMTSEVLTEEILEEGEQAVISKKKNNKNT